MNRPEKRISIDIRYLKFKISTGRQILLKGVPVIEVIVLRQYDYPVAFNRPDRRQTSHKEPTLNCQLGGIVSVMESPLLFIAQLQTGQ